MLTIDPQSTASLGEQIEHGIRRAIACGDLQGGQELPPVRQLAGDLGVNFNTVARAYRNLERDGLLQTRRGQGTFVRAISEIDHPRAFKKALQHVRVALTDVRLAGLDREAAKALIEDEFEAVWSRN